MNASAHDAPWESASPPSGPRPTIAALRRSPAVDCKRRRRDVGRFVREQNQRRAGDLLRCAGATHGDRVVATGDELLLVEAVRRLLGRGARRKTRSMGVSTGPGQIALTRMFFFASRLPSAFTNPTTPCFTAE